VSYRLARNPWILFLVAPLCLFLVLERLPAARARRRERRAVGWGNVALVATAAVMSSIFGLWPYAILQLTALAVAGAAGVWLFYVQHQFEGAYWARDADWDYAAAALRGSSFYELPKVLQWFSGNIGFHHVHHLSPRIPSYHLQACHRSDPLFRAVRPLTLRSSAKSLRLRLWDESAQEMVGFGSIPKRRRRSRFARERARA
jgi:omega-6 fatty acid desaturase (delta-12 desaturase)